MKIALCLQYPIGLRGGVSVLVETLMEELAAAGHQIVLVSSDSPEALCQSKAGKFIAEHFYCDPSEMTIGSARNLARQLAAARIDLAHFHAGGNYGWGNRLPFHCPVYFLDRLGIPCLWTSHLVVSVLDGFCGPQKPLWFKWLVLPLAWLGKMQQLSHTRVEIAVSQHDFQKLRRWYWPLRRRFVQIYHSRLKDGSPDLENFKREKIILNVGHIAWRKGQFVLAQAFAQIAGRHPEWVLQFAGDENEGTEAGKIRGLAKEKKLESRIQLLGERADTLDLMNRAAIYVQPSFWEALGLALQEAMFCGCACIGSRAGGIPELIQNGQTGLLLEPGNIEQLAQALERLICNADQREKFGRAAAASVRNSGMTAKDMLKRHLELYQMADH